MTAPVEAVLDRALKPPEFERRLLGGSEHGEKALSQRLLDQMLRVLRYVPLLLSDATLEIHIAPDAALILEIEDHYSPLR